MALSGGIGGAKLALGLSRVLPPEDLLVIANTGDDFEHLGLSISPDIDTLMYVLAGLDNPVTGWGRRDETWSFMETIGSLGGEDWFRLGDRDLATHVERTRRLRGGETLSQVTADFCRRLGIAARVLPMTDDRVRTRLRSDAGWIDFQDYFVRQQCRPVVHEIAFDGAADARPQPDFLAALRSGQVRAVVICPSNPFISVEPILAVPGLRAALAAVRRAGRGGVADHRRAGGEGADREDHDRTRHSPECCRRGAALRGFAGRLRDRPRGCGAGRRPGEPRHAGAYADDLARRSRGAGARGPRRGRRDPTLLMSRA
ncbi:MAG: 2-phospho-L-lactate transferase CofD family protein [Acetobacteraceae bacterium]